MTSSRLVCPMNNPTGLIGERSSSWKRTTNTSEPDAGLELACFVPASINKPIVDGKSVSVARSSRAKGVPASTQGSVYGTPDCAAICSIVHCRAGLSGLQRSSLVPWRKRPLVT